MAVNHQWPDIEPWSFIDGDIERINSYYDDLRSKFPNSSLYPFAIICDQSGFWNDGYVVLACFDIFDLSGDPKVMIYDYGRQKKSPLNNMSYPNFGAWIEDAKKESQCYKAQREELEQEDD